MSTGRGYTAARPIRGWAHGSDRPRTRYSIHQPSLIQYDNAGNVTEPVPRTPLDADECLGSLPLQE